MIFANLNSFICRKNLLVNITLTFLTSGLLKKLKEIMLFISVAYFLLGIGRR